ncbi:sensor histidine kinase, partial [Pedobacter sp.]|uniref:sensor histidine kinase n=1 Tax=Pedobacter sp. TaxID=1411316 RepID=UPI003C36E7B9
FRTIQEIVNNAIKYAQASEIKINVEQNAKNLKINITDNGQGFDYESEKNKSFGLMNIHSRIMEIRGNINLKTSAGKGTDYTIQIEL